MLVLTTYDTDADIVRAVEAGARGYLLKDAPTGVLADAIRRAARGETVLAAPVAARLAERRRGPARPDLTLRELDVLRLVARGLSNADIGRELFIGEATVKTHLIRAFAKLGVDRPHGRGHRGLRPRPSRAAPTLTAPAPCREGARGRQSDRLRTREESAGSDRGVAHVLDDLCGCCGDRLRLAAVLEVLVDHREHREEDDEQDRGLEVVADDGDTAEEVAGQVSRRSPTGPRRPPTR